VREVLIYCIMFNLSSVQNIWDKVS